MICQADVIMQQPCLLSAKKLYVFSQVGQMLCKEPMKHTFSLYISLICFIFIYLINFRFWPSHSNLYLYF